MHKSSATSILLPLFVVVLLADIVLAYLNIPSFRLVSKPLIVLTLLGYFLAATSGVSNSVKGWIIGALAFSWLGDVLLLFEGTAPIYFLLGLSSFLLAHIAYIVAFNHIRKSAGIPIKVLRLIPVLVYYIALILLLYNHLGAMMYPVMVYGLVISTMLAVAVHIKDVKEKKAGAFFLWGALCFVGSDSILAINKFLQPFEGAGLLIMATYGLAQFFIVKGSIAVVNRRNINAPVVVEKEEV